MYFGCTSVEFVELKKSLIVMLLTLFFLVFCSMNKVEIMTVEFLWTVDVRELFKLFSPHTQKGQKYYLVPFPYDSYSSNVSHVISFQELKLHNIHLKPITITISPYRATIWLRYEIMCSFQCQPLLSYNFNIKSDVATVVRQTVFMIESLKSFKSIANHSIKRHSAFFHYLSHPHVCFKTVRLQCEYIWPYME